MKRGFLNFHVGSVVHGWHAEITGGTRRIAAEMPVAQPDRLAQFIGSIQDSDYNKQPKIGSGRSLRNLPQIEGLRCLGLESGDNERTS